MTDSFYFYLVLSISTNCFPFQSSYFWRFVFFSWLTVQSVVFVTPFFKKSINILYFFTLYQTKTKQMYAHSATLNMASTIINCNTEGERCVNFKNSFFNVCIKSSTFCEKHQILYPKEHT